MHNIQPWWKTGVIYEVYVRSFQDSNGDGIGDLAGLTQRVPYLAGLGIDAIWISPFYQSPMRDFGYDISDYCAIEPIFGTLDDFDRLVATAHAHSLKVILDFVPNHTSDQHPWFVAARARRDSPKRDWYGWHEPGEDGGPPNNWLSIFGGSAWEYDTCTNQYYLHTFLKEQPDLNWRNPGVKAAMFDTMRFWLDRGVDGFRVDVIYALLKDDFFRDDPTNLKFRPGDNPYESLRHDNSLESPDVHDLLREMRELLDSYDGERVLIGETFHLSTLERFVSYYGKNLDECHLPFNFQLIMRAWDAQTIRAFVEEYEQVLPIGAWPNWVLSNHDQHRIATRAGSLAQAKLAQMLLLTLRGTPTCYYGDELGMSNVPIALEDERDPFGIRVPGQGRDPERTPMLWDSTPYAGFSTVKPWLPLTDGWQDLNVAAQQAEATSILTLFRALVALRRALPTLHIGSYATFACTPSSVFAYLREHGGERVLIVLQFGAEPCVIDTAVLGVRGEVLLSTYLDRIGSIPLDQIQLRAHEGLIVRLA
ncbi:MAG: DUF3459 domain-containing protein [Chloroflexi bacterium SZAS-1]|jgi:alpha-glucosidase|nr:DUF3459 domain-containing protein [Chloroflexi bacterium SZAS-1]